MQLRHLLFQHAFRRAHKAMKLGPSFPIASLPLCYHSDKHDPKVLRAQKRSFIVVGQNEYTLWFDDHERTSYWTCWSSNSVDEFIRKFHDSKIHGQFATYSVIITNHLYGRYMDFALKGKVHEYEEKRSQVGDTIAQSLERYLESFTHRAICLLLGLAK
jgi:hypothetical protein